jgi:hypothetical protein
MSRPYSRLGHAAIVVPPAVPITNAVRVADEERADVTRDAEVDDFARGLMPQVTDTPFGPATHLVLCPKYGNLPQVGRGKSSGTLSSRPPNGTGTPAPILEHPSAWHKTYLFCVTINRTNMLMEK